MKGDAAGMPVGLLVAITIAIILLGIMIFIVNPFGDIALQESIKSALTSCCTSYMLGGGCVNPDPDFICSVPEIVSEDKQMTISLLSAEAHFDYQDYCCGEQVE